MRTGHSEGARKKAAHSERYRREARKADFGTRPGQVAEDVTDVY